MHAQAHTAAHHHSLLFCRINEVSIYFLNFFFSLVQKSFICSKVVILQQNQSEPLGRTVSRFSCYTTADTATAVVASPGIYDALYPNCGSQLRAADGHRGSQSDSTPGTRRNSGGVCLSLMSGLFAQLSLKSLVLSDRRLIQAVKNTCWFPMVSHQREQSWERGLFDKVFSEVFSYPLVREVQFNELKSS